MYVELHARSAFSFLRAASLPEQLAEVAAQLAMPAMALCDRDGLYGAPRFFAAAHQSGVRPIIGSELTMRIYRRIRSDLAFRGFPLRPPSCHLEAGIA